MPILYIPKDHAFLDSVNTPNLNLGPRSKFMPGNSIKLILNSTFILYFKYIIYLCSTDTDTNTTRIRTLTRHVDTYNV